MFFFQQLFSKHAGQILPTDCPYYARVERVVNRLLMANTDMPQVSTMTWTVIVLDDEKSINAFVLPVNLETI